MRKKGDIEWDEMLPWLIALVVIAIGIGAWLVESGRAQGIADYLGNKLRFWG